MSTVAKKQEMDLVSQLAEQIRGLQDKAENNRKDNERMKGKMEELLRDVEINAELKKRVEEMTRELSHKDGQINELVAEIKIMKEKMNEIGSDLYKCQRELKAKDDQEEIIKKASAIVKEDKKIEKTAEEVQAAKEEITASFSEIVKEQKEIKKRQDEEAKKAQAQSQVDIKQEVKEIINKGNSRYEQVSSNNW